MKKPRRSHCPDCAAEPFHCGICHVSFTDRNAYDEHRAKRGQHYLPNVTGGRFVRAGFTASGQRRWRTVAGQGTQTEMPVAELLKLEETYRIEARRLTGKHLSSKDLRERYAQIQGRAA